ncbi:ATP-dependent DNA helicase RecQ-like [Montipora foliosa]|uniref:ATP-dependent DNA helicase RecQ-like n=1 Tax=Montipora foliosa TaxID=591990 RepID=UPI0035F150F2
MPEELDVVFEAALQKALNFLSERGFNRELRQEQKSSVKQLFTGGDLIAVLPTGFGKSLIFQLLALVNDGHVVLVICPLKCIVNDQIKEASSMGISAGSLSDCLQTDIVSGKYRLLFASAEEARAKSFLQALKREGNSLHDNLAAIVVDESHTVETWTGKR